MQSMTGYPGYAFPPAISTVPPVDEQPRGGWALGPTRILIGILWWTQLIWKAPKDFGSPRGCPTSLHATHLHGLCDWMHRAALHPIMPIYKSDTTITLYADFIKNTVIPHYTLFGWLTFGIETFITASLILGLFTRLGGLIGTVWALNLAVALWSVPGTWYWSYLMLAALNLIFFATAAGRYLGLDALLTRATGPLGAVLRFIG